MKQLLNILLSFKISSYICNPFEKGNFLSGKLPDSIKVVHLILVQIV